MLERGSGDRCGRSGHAGCGCHWWDPDRRLRRQSAGREAARQDRDAQSQLQPRTARRQIARRLCAAGRTEEQSSSSSCRTANASPTTTRALWDQLGQAIAPLPERSDRRSPRAALTHRWRSCRCSHLAPCCCRVLSCRCTCSNRGINNWSRDCLEAPAARVRSCIDRSGQRGRWRRHAVRRRRGGHDAAGCRDGRRSIRSRRYRHPSHTSDRVAATMTRIRAPKSQEWPDGDTDVSHERLEATASHRAAMCRTRRRDG